MLIWPSIYHHSEDTPKEESDRIRDMDRKKGRQREITIFYRVFTIYIIYVYQVVYRCVFI